MENFVFFPLVSIIIPVYNGSNFLREAIESALAQTYKNIEIIVVNDGSKDNGATEDIALSYGDRLRYFKKENGGVSTALNLGIQNMMGEYFSWLSHDDLYHPEKIQKEIDLLSVLPDKRSIIYCNSIMISHDNKILKKVETQDLGHTDSIFLGLYILHDIHGCSFLIAKSLLIEQGLFREDLRSTQDYQMWFDLAKRGANFVKLDEYFVLGRIHGEQTTNKMKRLYRNREIYALYVENMDFARQELRRLSPPHALYRSLVFASIGTKYPSLLLHFLYVTAQDKGFLFAARLLAESCQYAFSMIRKKAFA